MTRCALLALFVAHTASAEPGSTPTQAELDADVQAEVAHVLGGGGNKWHAAWTGDLTGSTGGSVLTVQRIMMTTSIGGSAMNDDLSGQAPQQLVVSLRDQGGTFSVSNVRLDLPDGTHCGIKDTLPELQVSEPSKEDFAATLSGTLGCGEGKAQQVTVEIRVDASPSS